MGQPGRKSTIYGSAVTADGRGLPMTVDNNTGLADKAGIEPSRLDGAISSLIKLCEDGAELLDQNGPMLTVLMQRVQKEAQRSLAEIERVSLEEDRQRDAGEIVATIPGINDQLARALEIANKVSIVMDRVNKMLVNAIKAKDTAVRLRTFIATGDMEQTGLENMSESALRRMVNETANGEMLPQEERKAKVAVRPILDADIAVVDITPER